LQAAILKLSLSRQLLGRRALLLEALVGDVYSLKAAVL
jgi:hypothetical protein